MLDSYRWNLANPAETLTDSDIIIRMKPTQRKEIAGYEVRTYSLTPNSSLKSQEIKFQADYHHLTPTKSSILKTQEKYKYLVKGKRSVELLKKAQSSRDASPKEWNDKKSENMIKRKHLISDEESKKTIANKKSNPKNLKINTECFEGGYSSNIDSSTTPVDIIKLKVLPNHEAYHNKKEATFVDMLTGKICSSKKEIHNSMLWKQKKKVHIRKLCKKVSEKEFEVSFSDEFSMSLPIYWQNFSYQLAVQVNLFWKLFFKNVMLNQKSLFKKKVDKINFSRPKRNLKDVSMKIGKIIENVLLKQEGNLQFLIEKVAEVPKLPLAYNSQYSQSQHFFVELFLCLWNFRIKPLTVTSISVYLEADRLISELHKQKDPTLKLQNILNIIPLMIIHWRHSEAQTYINKCLEISPNNKQALIWRAWLEILTTKNTSDLYYQLADTISPPNFSIHLKVALIYCFYFSCLFRSHSRTIAFIKTQSLDDWDNLLIADLYLRSNDKFSEEMSMSILNQLYESCPNPYVRFLATFKLFHIYKDYNQCAKALDLLKHVQDKDFSDQYKIILDCCKMKILAAINAELNPNFDSPLTKYQYARLSAKYNLKSSLHKVLSCLNDSCAYSQLYSLQSCLFEVNFWKFIIIKKLGIHKFAVKQAILTIDYETNDKVKSLAIHEYIKNIESAKSWIEAMAQALEKKDSASFSKYQELIGNFDKFLNICIKIIMTKKIQDKEKLPVHKFEGFFAIWSCLYRDSKHKEKQYKSLEGQEEIDRRDKKHPLYIISVLSI